MSADPPAAAGQSLPEMGLARLNSLGLRARTNVGTPAAGSQLPQLRRDESR